MTPDPEEDERRLFLPSKTNLGRLRDGLAYRIGTRLVGDDSDIEAPCIEWAPNTVSVSADEAVLASTSGAEGKTAKSEAIEFLRVELANGAVAAGEIKKRGCEAGHTDKALRTAREALGIKPRKDGYQGAWVWEL